MSGDFEKEVVVSIVDDSVPELNEVFCISLILPEGGAVIGDIPEGIYIYNKSRYFSVYAYVHVCYCVCVGSQCV